MGNALKFCLVAEGKADIYLRDLPTMEWDTGVYSLDNKPLGYGKPGLKNSAIMTGDL